MLPESIRSLLRPIRKALTPRADRYLRRISGIIHVGANIGQERDVYRDHGVEVLWIEPIPEVFARLQERIRGFERQRALQALVTEVDDREYVFHVANNHGASSSLLELGDHRDIWPEVEYTHSIPLRGVTLPTLLAREGIDPARYQALALDTQGSELLVLRGAEPLLAGFDYIHTEVADFEVYRGCCRLDELTDFLGKHGFREMARGRFAKHPRGGACYEVVFRRRGAR